MFYGNGMKFGTYLTLALAPLRSAPRPPTTSRRTGSNRTPRPAGSTSLAPNVLWYSQQTSTESTVYIFEKKWHSIYNTHYITDINGYNTYYIYIYIYITCIEDFNITHIIEILPVLLDRLWRSRFFQPTDTLQLTWRPWQSSGLEDSWNHF